MHIFFMLVCLMNLLLMTTHSSYAQTNVHMRTFGTAPSTEGRSEVEERFCREYPDECDETTAKVLLYSRTLLVLLERINSRVNDEVQYSADLETYGVHDYWTLPQDGVGDCEDYVLEKIHRLVSAGIPRGALLMTFVTSPRAGGHMVLSVVTNKGEFILDNRTPEVRHWSEIRNYTFVERKSPDGEWVMLRQFIRYITGEELIRRVRRATAPPH